MMVLLSCCGEISGWKCGREAALPEIPVKLTDVGEPVIGKRVADGGGHGEKACYLLRAETVVTPAFKDEAIARAAFQGIHFVAYPALTHVTNAAFTVRHGDGAQSDRVLGVHHGGLLYGWGGFVAGLGFNPF